MVIFSFLFVIIWLDDFFSSFVHSLARPFSFRYFWFFYAFPSLISYHTFIHCDCCNVTFNDNKRAVWETMTSTTTTTATTVSLYAWFFCSFSLSHSLLLGLHLCVLLLISCKQTAIIGLVFCSFTFFCSLSPPNVHLCWSFRQKLWHLNQ